MPLKRAIHLTTLYLSLSILLGGCGIYSFTGASIPPDAKTITIKYFPNYAANINPTLSQSLTEDLKDKFLTQTSLTQVNSDGDLILEGSITEYYTQPNAIQAGDQAASSRLTIGVKVKFTNKKDPKFNFEKDFKRFSDYSSTQTLTEAEPELIRAINTLLVGDIFNQAVVNW